MSPVPRTCDPEALLAQAGWVRGLVRKLVLDETLVEDVLQDTWVAALECPGPAAERGGLRAWLAAVARNLALRKRRREAVRAAVERAAARAEPIEGGQGEVERMQLQRALADAVLALEEPYRSAVILRHLDGLSAAALARRQGCTTAAARQRVSRGLAQLRRHLERRHGRDADGCLALLPLLGHGWSAGVLTGGILVSTKLTLGAMGAALVALALWMAMAGEGGRVERAGAHAGESEAVAGAAEDRRVKLEPDEELAPAPLVAAQTSKEVQRAEIAREATAAPAPGKLVVRGRITDTRGQPLADAVLRLAGEERGLWMTSDAAGVVAAELDFAPKADEQALHVACDGYVERELTLDLRVPFEIELQALPALAGRLIDPRGGAVAPPGYVKARVLDVLTHERREAEAELDADGTYRVERLPLGELVSVEARARGYAARTLPLAHVLEPDRTLALDVELARGATVTGTVLDARTREPVAGATVWMETFAPDAGSVHPSTTADEAGRFRLEGANEDVQFQEEQYVVFFRLVAEADGYAATPTRAYGAVANDRHAYDFEMLLERSGCSLRIEIVLADGTPAREATVWAIDAQGNPFFETADPNGRHAFEDLPAGPFALWLACDERAQDLRLGPIGPGVYAVETGRRDALRVELELAPGEAREERLVLQAPGKASVSGRVLDLNERGVPDFPVRCQLNFQLNNLMLASGWDELRTGADGRYRFEGLHPGKYQVWASGEGTALACAQPGSTYVEVEADRRAEVEDLVVGACLTIEGHVDPGGLDLAALELSARDPASGAALAGTRPEADGSFRFDPLVARDYEIVLLRGEQVLDRAIAGPESASGLHLRAR